MSVTSALKRHQREAPEAPPRKDTDGMRESLEYQLGYRVGWHHAMQDAIEIAEEEEDD